MSNQKMDYTFSPQGGEFQKSHSTEISSQVKVDCFSHLDCPQIKNHTAIIYNKCIVIFGGYDGKKNHNTLYMYNIETQDWTKPKVSGTEPAGRNGHTATLIGK